MTDSGVYSFEEILDLNGVFAYTSAGTSMMPLLREGKDIVEIWKKEPGRCKQYDVVLYKRNGQYILHRILRVLPSGYLIAGDNSFLLERDITDVDILGVMKRVVRDGKSITLRDPLYRLYVHLWCDCYPLRMFLLKGVSFARHHLQKMS